VHRISAEPALSENIRCWLPRRPAFARMLDRLWRAVGSAQSGEIRTGKTAGIVQGSLH